MQGLILSDFQILKNLWWVAAKYEENIRVIKNKVTVILLLYFVLQRC